MSGWKTINTKTVEAGGNNFIEVSLKQPPEGDNVFIGISKGWMTEEGEKRYKTNILFAKEKALDVVKAIEEISNS
jgi:hypothetical protein